MKKFLPVLGILYLAFATLYLAPDVLAFSSSSDNYKLEGDFGIFGGAKSSTNYKITDTGGGFAIGFGSSANYGTGSGFQYVLAEVPELVFQISSTTVDLGSLSGTPKGVSQTITVTTNAHDGYKVTVQEDGNLCRTTQPCNSTNDIDPVSGGTVKPNTEAYGLATSKAGQDIIQNTSCGSSFEASAITTSPQTIASPSLPINNDTTTLCYSAAISGTTAAGNYTHVLTYVATGTF
jgi:hypothetical protein